MGKGKRMLTKPKANYAPCYQCLTFSICNGIVKEELKLSSVVIDPDTIELTRINPDIFDFQLVLGKLCGKCFLIRAYLDTNKADVYHYRVDCLEKVYRLSLTR